MDQEHGAPTELGVCGGFSYKHDAPTELSLAPLCRRRLACEEENNNKSAGARRGAWCHRHRHPDRRQQTLRRLHPRRGHVNLLVARQTFWVNLHPLV